MAALSVAAGVALATFARAAWRLRLEQRQRGALWRRRWQLSAKAAGSSA